MKRLNAELMTKEEELVRLQAKYDLLLHHGPEMHAEIQEEIDEGTDND